MRWAPGVGSAAVACGSCGLMGPRSSRIVAQEPGYRVVAVACSAACANACAAQLRLVIPGAPEAIAARVARAGR